MAKLYFRYGAMNCGKTTNVIQTAYNYYEKGKKVLLIKPKIDTKGESSIINRTGLSKKVDVLLASTDKIRDFLTNDIDAIIVDEAEFMTIEQVKELYTIAKIDNIPVLCYGLRCDFQMEPFPASIYLLALADEISELKTICRCGKKATQNLRLENGIPIFEGESVVIDGAKANTTYESVCGECYLKIRYPELDRRMRRERKK